ncbi:MAG: DUF3341 domain-containing protein [Bdellovibrionales bacterium]
MAKKVGGLLGIWSNEHDVLEAAHKVREAGFKKFDAITPFPIHGMDDAIGLHRSKIPIVTFLAALFGTCAGLGLQSYILVWDWPLLIGGKPHFSLPAFIPIIFETTILFGALITVGTMLAWNGLPNINAKIADPRLTDDKFALFIPEDDIGYEVGKIDKLFQQLGAEEVKKVEEF